MKTLRAITPNFIKYPYGQLRSLLNKMTFPKTVSCKVRGVVIKVGVNSEIEQFRVDTYNTKEPETLDWLDDNLRSDDVLIDVGANIGLYSLYAAKINPKCRIYALEPAFQNFTNLCNNIVLNAVQNIIPCNFPLADRETFDVFFVSDIQPGSALHSFGQPSDFKVESNAISLQQGALSMTLDALVSQYGLPQPSLIKIDVDGIEEKIIKGAQNVLQSKQMRTMLLEWSFRSDEDITRLEQTMRHLGYSLSRRSAWAEEHSGLKGQNFIFHRR